MKIRIVGDHSDVHGGCQAVFSVLREILLEAGELVNSDQEEDVLVVNGEGSMHHDSSACLRKLAEIEDAQERGKRTWLVNSVWQQNNSSYDDTIKRLDGLWVRGPRSADDLRHRHSIEARWGLDLSYFARVEDVVAPIDFAGETVATDFWDSRFSHFVRPTVGAMASMPFLDMGAFSWAELIASIRTCGMLITGRHHAMYAACKARKPFIPIAANTHKMEDLLRGAPCSIPVCTTWKEVREAMNWLKRNSVEYDRLFDWMEKQEVWRFDYPANQYGYGRSRAEQACLEARTHVIKGTAIDALPILDAGLKEEPTNPALINVMRNAKFLSGKIVDSALATAFDRLRSPRHTNLDRQYAQVVSAGLRTGIDDSSRHWSAVGRVIELPPFHELTHELIEDALNVGNDDVTFEAVRGVLNAVFQIQRNWEATELVESIASLRTRPDWLVAYDRLNLTVKRQRFHATYASDVSQNLWGPAFSIAQKLDAVEYLIKCGRVDEALVDRLVSVSRTPSSDPDGQFACLAVAATASAGMDELSKDLIRSIPKYLPAATRILSVSALNDDDQTSALSRLHRDLVDNSARLSDALRDDRKYISLVGNGVDEEKFTGDLIDKSDLVVRFNDFRLAGKKPFLGSKIGLIGTVHHAKPGLSQPNRHAAALGVMLTHPSILFTRQNWKNVLDCWHNGVSFSLLPDTVRLDLQSRLGVSPSSGLHMAALLRDLRRGTTGLTLFHMPLLQGTGFHTRHRGRTTTRHNWSLESELVREYGLTVV